MPRLAWIALFPALGIAACAQGGFTDAGAIEIDAGDRDDAGHDAGRFDAGRISLPDAGHDAGPVIDAGMMDGGRDAGMTGVCTPSAASIAIVEVMIASRTGSGDLGEWFEVKNIGPCTVNLTGMIIDSPTGTTPHTVMVSSGIVAPGESYVLAQSGNGADNHGLGHDYVYGGTITFENGNDSLGLSFGGSEFDRVSWTSTDFLAGSSRQLARDADVTMNSTLGATTWCNATTVYSSSGGTFRGTPQMVNEDCP